MRFGFSKKDNTKVEVKMPCARCGKEMVTENRQFVVGVHIDAFVLPLMDDFVNKQFGKYKERNYNFCIECWLDSLFGKHNDRET